MKLLPQRPISPIANRIILISEDDLIAIQVSHWLNENDGSVTIINEDSIPTAIWKLRTEFYDLVIFCAGQCSETVIRDVVVLAQAPVIVLTDRVSPHRAKELGATDSLRLADLLPETLARSIHYVHDRFKLTQALDRVYTTARELSDSWLHLASRDKVAH